MAIEAQMDNGGPREHRLATEITEDTEKITKSPEK
jgi:hypothetical protein